MTPSVLPFAECEEEARFGGKVVSLGAALRAGLPAPPGYGVDVETVRKVVSGDEASIAAVEAVFADLAPAVAVRSSGVGEDSADASFAGQHESIMNVREATDVSQAVIEVHKSGHTESAISYREKVGADVEAAIAVAIQKQIPSDTSGVMFTRNPITGDDERYVEVALGLGEAVVAGLIVPDTYRFSRDGEIIEAEPGDKDIMLVLDDGGGTREEEVEQEKATALCLSQDQVQQLNQLAVECERVYGEHLDMEFAFHEGTLYLLQCRSITTL